MVYSVQVLGKPGSLHYRPAVLLTTVVSALAVWPCSSGPVELRPSQGVYCSQAAQESGSCGLSFHEEGCLDTDHNAVGLRDRCHCSEARHPTAALPLFRRRTLTGDAQAQDRRGTWGPEARGPGARPTYLPPPGVHGTPELAPARVLSRPIKATSAPLSCSVLPPNRRDHGRKGAGR